jgi:hypothetical protein
LGKWSERQDSNLRPLRPERSAYFLSYCFLLGWRPFPPRFVHGHFTQFIAISLRRSDNRFRGKSIQMPIDPDVLAEALTLVVKARMADYAPSGAAPPCTSGELIAIALIDPPARSPGTPNFDKPDPDRPGVVRSADILSKIGAGVPMEPVLLIQRRGEKRYRLWNGFHRFHLCTALGFTHVPAEITDGEY